MRNMYQNFDSSPVEKQTEVGLYKYLDADSLSVIEELMDGDAELIFDLVDTLIETTPELLEELAAGVEAKDSPAIKNAAHALKSSNAQMGALSFAALCQEMENKGKNNDLEQAEDLLQLIKEEFSKVTQALESWKQVLAN